MEPNRNIAATLTQTLHNLNTTQSNGEFQFWYSRIGVAGTCDFTVSLSTATIYAEHSITTTPVAMTNWVLKSVGSITPPASTADLKISLKCNRRGVDYLIDDVSFERST
jgi:hypothetical protein